jgi:hypothetical protein
MLPLRQSINRPPEWHNRPSTQPPPISSHPIPSGPVPSGEAPSFHPPGPLMRLISPAMPVTTLGSSRHAIPVHERTLADEHLARRRRPKITTQTRVCPGQTLTKIVGSGQTRGCLAAALALHCTCRAWPGPPKDLSLPCLTRSLHVQRRGLEASPGLDPRPRIVPVPGAAIPS